MATTHTGTDLSQDIEPCKRIVVVVANVIVVATYYYEAMADILL